MLRSHSFRKLKRVTPSGRKVIHYKRHAYAMPHCAICDGELNGISLSKNGGSSRRKNSRIFGGVLCAKCTSEVITLGSRIEQGDMKLDAIGVKKRSYVLQLVAH